MWDGTVRFCLLMLIIDTLSIGLVHPELTKKKYPKKSYSILRVAFFLKTSCNFFDTDRHFSEIESAHYLDNHVYPVLRDDGELLDDVLEPLVRGVADDAADLRRGLLEAVPGRGSLQPRLHQPRRQ